MANYCDTTELQDVWCKWWIGYKTPHLEEYRCGYLVTKIPQNPFNENYSHYLSVAKPNPLLAPSVVHFNTNNGIPTICLPYKHNCSKPVVLNDYYLSHSTSDYWQRLLEMISLMCMKISSKFNLTEDDRCELSHEVVIQVASKLQRGKLIFTPGKAAVFSLLTTTIRNCMFTILSKNTRIKNNNQKYIDTVLAQA